MSALTEKQCIDCQTAIQHKGKRCSPCATLRHRQHTKNWFAKNQGYRKRYDHERAYSPEQRYFCLLHNARKRSLLCTLTFDQFRIYLEAECHYCGGYFEPTKRTQGTRIDRLDNSRGYVQGNCVPACDFCNSLKSNSLTPQQARVAIQALITFDQQQKRERP